MELKRAISPATQCFQQLIIHLNFLQNHLLIPIEQVVIMHPVIESIKDSKSQQPSSARRLAHTGNSAMLKQSSA
jgi:hypothetical protein